MQQEETVAASVIGYSVLGVVVLWMPVHALAHAISAAYTRRTCVSAALSLRVSHGAPMGPRSSHSSAKGGADDGNAAEEEADLSGRRFAAPHLAAALIGALTREAAAASTADLQRPPKYVALRPLLRTPLLAALGPRAAQSASQRLAARKKPTGLAWRMKRWLVSELQWQAREMRHFVRTLRRFLGGSRDPIGKTFRAVAVSPSGGSDAAVLVEVTWHFGLVARNGAACWRRRLRDGEQLAALEAALEAELSGLGDGVRHGLEVRLVADGHPALEDGSGGAVVLALLDDSPHANLDKKLKEKRTTSVADVAEAEIGADGRSVGIAPAVAQRLEAVLAVCALRRTSVAGATRRFSFPGKVQAATKRIAQLFDESLETPLSV